jgi:hypothetical protein
MERIKQALERAREQRKGNQPEATAKAPQQRKHDHSPAPAPQDIVYTHTRQIDICLATINLAG